MKNQIHHGKCIVCDQNKLVSINICDLCTLRGYEVKEGKILTPTYESNRESLIKTYLDGAMLMHNWMREAEYKGNIGLSEVYRRLLGHVIHDYEQLQKMKQE